MQRRILWAALFALIAVKVAAIAYYGPLLQPDSGGYITFADTILTSPEHLVDRPNTMGEDAYRMAGYPALIAASKAFTPTAWGFLVLAAQSIIGIVATVLIYRFARAATRSWPVALVVAAAYATSQVIVFEQHILTDALYGHLIAIVIALLGLAIVRHPTRLTPFVIAGLVLGVGFLIREFTLFLLPAFLPLAIVAAIAHRGRPVIRLAAPIVVLLPTLLLAGLYSTWNEARTGTAFLTTGARTAALLPLVQMEGRGISVFVGDDILDRTARDNLSTYFYADVIAINRALSATGMSGVEMSDLANDRFYATMRNHPLAFVRHIAGELRFDRRAKALANPIGSVRDLQTFRNGQWPESFSKWLKRAFGSGNPTWIAAALAEGVTIFIDFFVAAVAFFVFPVWYLARLAVHRRAPLLWHAMAGAWAAYSATAVAYSFIRLEDRYLMGHAPFMIIVGVVCIVTAAKAFLARRPQPAPEGAG